MRENSLLVVPSSGLEAGRVAKSPPIEVIMGPDKGFVASTSEFLQSQHLHAYSELCSLLSCQPADHNAIYSLGDFLLQYRPDVYHKRNQKCPKIDDPDQEILGMIYPLLEEAVYTGNILDLTDEGMSALAYLVNNLAKVARGKLGRNGGFNQEKFRKLHEGIGQFMNEWNRNIPRPKNKIAVQNFWWAFRHINGHLESNLNMGIAYVIKDLLIALSQLQHTELKQKDALIQQMLVGTGQNERRGASLHNFLPGQSGSARYRLMHFFPEEMPYAAVAILFLRFSTENAALAV